MNEIGRRGFVDLRNYSFFLDIMVHFNILVHFTNHHGIYQ